MVEKRLQELLNKYQTCTSYVDIGVLYTEEKGQQLPAVRFATHFERPASLRFEWSGQTRIKRPGLSKRSNLSTIITQSSNGFPTYYDPGNLEEPCPKFSTIREALLFDRPYSGWVVDIAVSILSADFEHENRILTQQALSSFQLRLDSDSEDYEYFRTFRSVEEEYTMTFEEEISVSPDLHISQFKQTRSIKKEDKKPLRSLDHPSYRSAQQRWLSQDSFALSDYQFEEVRFNCEIPPEVFLDARERKLDRSKILRFPT